RPYITKLNASCSTRPANHWPRRHCPHSPPEPGASADLRVGAVAGPVAGLQGLQAVPDHRWDGGADGWGVAVAGPTGFPGPVIVARAGGCDARRGPPGGRGPTGLLAAQAARAVRRQVSTPPDRDRGVRNVGGQVFLNAYRPGRVADSDDGDDA